MRKIVYNKLVRDRIPDIILADGAEAVTRTLDPDEFRAALKSKLLEEATEVQDSDEATLPTELADVLELVQAIAESHGLDAQQVEAVRKQRAAERGEFRDRVFLLETLTS
jgi:predicted house-cleaning noncanonical NTP pyrophosphatase (MazG superfamily)